MTGAHETIRDLIVNLYASIGDRQRFDAHLDPDITIWESDADTLLRGLSALDQLRDERAGRPARGELAGLGPEEILVDAWGDTGVARYLLRARYAKDDGDVPDDVFRVTDVVRRGPDGWRIVHHHAEAYAG